MTHEFLMMVNYHHFVGLMCLVTEESSCEVEAVVSAIQVLSLAWYNAAIAVGIPIVTGVLEHGRYGHY